MGQMSRDLHQVPAVVREMSFLDVLDVVATWREAPPLHLMVAAYLGCGQSKSKPQPSSEAELRRMAEAMGCPFPESDRG